MRLGDASPPTLRPFGFGNRRRFGHASRMARIVFASAAYLGDVAPFVDPANRLTAQGHDVTFLAPAGFHAALAGEKFALATYPLDFSLAAMHADPAHEHLMRSPVADQLRLSGY